MAALTADQVVDQAFGRAAEFGGSYPSARGPMYRRVGYKQRHLFQRAAIANPERYGVCANSALTTGMVDLNDIVSPVPVPAIVHRVEVLDPGSSAYAVGTEITIVGLDDAEAELAPRAFLRNGVLIGYGTDLDGVTTVRIYYPRLPDLFLLTDATKVVELEAPWDTILEVDLAIWLVEKATKMPQEVRAAALASLASEGSALEKDFLQWAADYAPMVSRFANPRVVAEE